MMKRLLAALAALFLSAAPVAAATSIVLLTPDPHFGGTVTFDVTELAKKYDCVGHARCARVLVECYQGGVLVYGEGGDLGQARGNGTSPLGYVGFQLGGSMSQWVQNGGGPADCTATLFRFDNGGPVQQFITIASTTFHAEG